MGPRASAESGDVARVLGDLRADKDDVGAVLHGRPLVLKTSIEVVNKVSE